MPRQSFHDRLFRLLLKLFPAEFRGDFGDNMAADFHDQRRDVEGNGGAVRTLWIRTVLDLLRRAPREHLDVLSGDAMYALRMLRRHPTASATAIVSLCRALHRDDRRLRRARPTRISTRSRRRTSQRIARLP
jgi:hypothetical protein